MEKIVKLDQNIITNNPELVIDILQRQFFINLSDFSIEELLNGRVASGKKVSKFFKTDTEKQQLALARESLLMPKNFDAIRITDSFSQKLQMSENTSMMWNGHPWRSCHSLDGGFKNAALSLAKDDDVFIAYANDEKGKKCWRSLIFAKDGGGILSKNYPFFNMPATLAVAKSLLGGAQVRLTNENFTHERRNGGSYHWYVDPYVLCWGENIENTFGKEVHCMVCGGLILDTCNHHYSLCHECSGLCPHCGRENYEGDCCDICQSLAGKCSICGDHTIPALGARTTAGEISCLHCAAKHGLSAVVLKNEITLF